jgi:hypothetical protein
MQNIPGGKDKSKENSGGQFSGHKPSGNREALRIEGENGKCQNQ